MTPETQAASTPKRERALILDTGRWVSAVLWLLETEAELRPERKTAHLVETGKLILSRMEEINPNTEAEDDG